MKLLHTADLHLKRGKEERLEVLAWLLEKAGDLKVDYFIIAGDLFDSDADATILRQKLRNMFDSVRYKFLIIPGNHDEHSFGPDFEYGDNVVQMTDKPFQIIEADGMKICGVPYENKRFSECNKDMPAGVEILIAHGTVYDPSFIFSQLEDPETEYMPIFPADIQNLARYVAMGHLHSRFVELRHGGTRVIYPGSPVALDTKCEGERCFSLVEVDKDRVEIEQCSVENARYWMTKKFFVYPQAEQKILGSIEKFLDSIEDPRVMPRVMVIGYIAEKEKEYLGALVSMRGKYEKRFEKLDFESSIQSWEKVISNPMIQRFVAKTANLEDRVRLKVFEICLPIFSRVLR